jgi:hypothetical protein
MVMVMESLSVGVVRTVVWSARRWLLSAAATWPPREASTLRRMKNGRDDLFDTAGEGNALLTRVLCGDPRRSPRRSKARHSIEYPTVGRKNTVPRTKEPRT